MTGVVAEERWVQAPRLLERRLLDGHLLLPARGDERPVVLRDTALAIWRAIEQPRGLDELVAALARSYEIDPATIADDVRGAIDELHHLRLVRPCP